jgi:hypothetical protein
MCEAMYEQCEMRCGCVEAFEVEVEVCERRVHGVCEEVVCERCSEI